MEQTNVTTIKTDFRLWLQSELTERCRRNPSYSLRSFAAHLKIEASSLSQILSGKRKVSTKVITNISEKLGASPAQLDVFLKKAKSKKTALPTNDQEYLVLAEDIFDYISNWYHAAILELTFINGFENNPQRIANALAITVTETKMAIERLLRLGLLKEENNKLMKTDKFLTNFTPGFTSSANKEFQRQILKKALDSIDHTPQEEKDITSMTMAIDVEKLPEAKKLITNFRRDLSAFLEDGKQTRVYNLAIQLYPISKDLKETI